MLRISIAVPIFVIAVHVAFSQTRPKPESADEHPQPGSALASVVDANTRFAFKLLRSAVTHAAAKNVLLAPTGISLAFGLLDNGADAQTQQEIETVFEFSGLDLRQINEGSAALRTALKLVEPVPQRTPKIAGLPPQATRLRQLYPGPPDGALIADSLWIDGYSSLDPRFIELAQKYYAVDLKQLSAKPNHTIEIERWARERTGVRIDMPVQPLKPNQFLLVDITHFRAFWKEEFEASATKPDWFMLMSGARKQVPMMHQRGSFRYLKGAAFQAAVLPYWEHASMYVLLPDENFSLSELEQSLSAEDWKKWSRGFESRDGHLALPRFEIRRGFDLKAALQALGLRRAFQELEAFKPAVPALARLTDALQTTNILVDEQHTEAISIASVRGVIGGIAVSAGGGHPKPFEMIINRPFFFAICDDPTGQLLFLGAVVEP